MSLLSNLQTDESIENEKDIVGGGPKDSALYGFEIDRAYIQTSKGGAMGLNLALKLDAGGEHRETLWITSGDKKGNRNYFETADGQKRYLPGFNIANSLALLTVGKELSQLDTEDKIVNVYNPDAKAEVPTTVPMIMYLIGKRGIAGLLKVRQFKNAKGDDGQYHATNEVRESNELDKIFRERDKMTTAEIRAQAEKATFIETWEKKWTDQVKDKTNGATPTNNSNGQTGAPKAAGANPVGGGNSKPTQSLFG